MNNIANMITVMFVELPEDEGRMVIGFQLNKENFYRVPKGKIRVARYDNMFWPHNNMGYYGDIYVKQFIKKWKKITRENIQRKNEKRFAVNLLKYKICQDMCNQIIEFI
jgi:hypothetical protein